MSEVTGGAPAPGTEVASPAAGQAALDPNATAAPGSQTPTGEQPEKPAQERTFTQKELDAIVQREKATERRRAARIAAAEAETKILREQAERTRNGGSEREERRGATEDQEPNPKDFNDYASYDRAIARWEARQVVRQEQERIEQGRKVERERETQREHFERDRAALMKGAKEFSDFEDVVFDDEAPITKAMVRAALETDIPSKVAYYLARPENRDEAITIAELPPTRQAAKVHELADRLAKAPKPNANPAPIKPSGGDAATASVDPDKLPMDQWLKWRNSQPDLKRKSRRT